MREARPNSSQQATRGRSLARRFRASCFAGSGVSLAGMWRPRAPERKNVRPSQAQDTGRQSTDDNEQHERHLRRPPGHEPTTVPYVSSRTHNACRERCRCALNDLHVRERIEAQSDSAQLANQRAITSSASQGCATSRVTVGTSSVYNCPSPWPVSARTTPNRRMVGRGGMVSRYSQRRRRSSARSCRCCRAQRSR